MSAVDFVNIHNSGGSHRVVLVCEHASAFIPPQYNNLGLDPSQALSHIAWDPGALNTARYLSRKLDAVLVEGTVSRLIYDLNRPPESAGAMIEKSEEHNIPGNTGLAEKEKQQRVDTYYTPFKNSLADVMANHPNPVLVTIHSFTPVYGGVSRAVEIGILHDTDTRLADEILGIASGYEIMRNEPYGPEDGVTHTLKLHALPNGYPNVMIEVCNTLISSDADCKAMADNLYSWIEQAMISLNSTATTEARL